MENPVTEVPLRKRATPYEFEVVVTSGDRQAKLFDGRAYRTAVICYWQAVTMLRFIQASGEVKMGLTQKRHPFGGFSTIIESGLVVTIHKPDGHCREWVTRGWVGHPIEEKVIATVPGTLGMPRDPDAN